MGTIGYFNKVIANFTDQNISAFGDLEVEEKEPVVQLDFVYGINTQTGVTTVSGTGATVDTINGMLRVQCGTNSTGSAIFNSRRIAKYRAGQGMEARYTYLFPNATANNRHYAGVGNASDGYFFGYKNTSFGVLHRLNGADTDFVAQTSWNVDKMDGTGPSGITLNPQKGNLYMVKYPYLGFGDIKFFVGDGNGGFDLVHVIAYANLNTVPEATNPNFFFWVENINSGNTGNTIGYSGSIGVFISGKRSFIGNPKWAIDNNKSGITAETNIISLKNATTYNGLTNRALIRLNSLSVAGASASTRLATFRLRINATIGGAPSFTTINGTTSNNGTTITSGNSIASYDIAGTTSSAGTLIFNTTINNSGNIEIDLTPYNIFIAPGEILTISGTGTGSIDMSVAINWVEDL